MPSTRVHRAVVLLFLATASAGATAVDAAASDALRIDSGAPPIEFDRASADIRPIERVPPGESLTETPPGIKAPLANVGPRNHDGAENAHYYTAAVGQYKHNGTYYAVVCYAAVGSRTPNIKQGDTRYISYVGAAKCTSNYAKLSEVRGYLFDVSGTRLIAPGVSCFGYPLAGVPGCHAGGYHHRSSPRQLQRVGVRATFELPADGTARWNYVAPSCTILSQAKATCGYSAQPFLFIPDDYPTQLPPLAQIVCDSYQHDCLAELTKPAYANVGASPGCGVPPASVSHPVPGGGHAQDPTPPVEPGGDVGDGGDAITAPWPESPETPDASGLCGDSEVNATGANHMSAFCTISGRVYRPAISSSGSVLSGTSAPFCNYLGSTVRAKHTVCLQRLNFAGVDKLTWGTVTGSCRVRTYSASQASNMTLTTRMGCRSNGTRTYRTLGELVLTGGGVKKETRYSPAAEERCVI